jgi:hypothetical protein
VPEENHGLTFFLPVAFPSSIEESANDEKLQKRYEELLTSLPSSEIDSPSSAHRSELDALFKMYYSASKVSADDHLRYCNANVHVIYIAPREGLKPIQDYRDIKNSFVAITQPSIDACGLLAKKVLPFAAIQVSLDELKRVAVHPDTEYTMYMMVFSRDNEKPLLLVGPYYSTLLQTHKPNKYNAITSSARSDAGITFPSAGVSIILGAIMLFMFACTMLVLSALSLLKRETME